MNRVNFQYNCVESIIECSSDEKFKNIIDKLFQILGENRKNVYILYNGIILNQELSFNQCANNLDKSRKYMNVIVFEMQNVEEPQQKVIKSKYIICPKCHENAFFEIKNFQISIFGCKNGHITEKLNIKEFQESQQIDISKIKCDFCQSSKYESIDNKFFVCNSCEKNICPRCKENHDRTHKIKIYEEKQFYCKKHNDIYIYYCPKCKKDLCSLCKNEHSNHGIIKYDDEIQNFNAIKNEDLRDTIDTFDKIKKIIKNVIDQLNKLNTNLDEYYEIYNNLITNYNSDQINYFLVKNIKNMKAYNDNFLGNLSEILQDTNLKSQFKSIINLYTKFEFKKIKHILEDNNTIEVNSNDNEIRQENNTNNVNINEDNEIIEMNEINENNPENDEEIKDEYDNFSIEKMKEIYSFKPKNSVDVICLLNDKGILTSQSYENDEGFDENKLCVYSIKKGFVCDINVDYSEENDTPREFILMNDGRVIIKCKHEIIIIKITKNNIEETWKLDNGEYSIKACKLLKENFLIKMHSKRSLYKYENDKLISYKELDTLYKTEDVNDLCQITENEYVLFIRKKGVLGENCSIIFYDMQNDKKIKTVKVGKGDKYYGQMILINDTNLIIQGEEFIVLVDIQKQVVIKEYNFDFYLSDIFLLNKRQFLHYRQSKLTLYEFDGTNELKLKEQKKMEIDSIIKYPGNKLITIDSDENKISIYGYN